jgi:beta-barrel assembly-enhancing protease
MNHSLKNSLLGMAMTLAVSMAAQPFEPSKFECLVSQGTIPSELLTNAYARYQSEVMQINATDKKTKDFQLKSNYALNDIIESGRVLFGDPLTVYANKVADKLLVAYPDLRREVKIYALKSPSINSFATPHGYIFINVGLFAKINSEAELAFVLAHEISHYKDKHSLNSYIESIDLNKGKGRYSGIPFDERIDQMYKNSRETELSADSSAIAMLLKSDYAPQAAIDMLSCLHYDYLPFRERPFDKTFFDRNDFIVPKSYFLDSIKTISRVEDYKDDNHTHPNISKRKERVLQLIGNDAKNGEALFTIPQSQFELVREIARFETIRLDLTCKNYGDAIYNSYVMLEKHPKNYFLQVSIAKALYGLVKHKSIEEFHQVAKSFSKVEGESQQLHALLKQLNKKQLNALGLSYCQQMRQEYPNDVFLAKMETELIEDMVIRNRTNLTTIQEQLKKDQAGIPANFYLHVYTSEEMLSPELNKKYERAVQKADSLSRIDAMPLKEREKTENELMAKAKQNGISKKIGGIIIVDPMVESVPLAKERDYLERDNMQATLTKAIELFAKKSQHTCTLLETPHMAVTETDNYNSVALLKEMIDDVMWVNSKINLLPLGTPNWLFEQNANKVVSRPMLFNMPNGKQLINVLIDMDNRKTVYMANDKVSSLSSETLSRTITDNFSIFKP